MTLKMPGPKKKKNVDSTSVLQIDLTVWYPAAPGEKKTEAAVPTMHRNISVVAAPAVHAAIPNTNRQFLQARGQIWPCTPHPGPAFILVNTLDSVVVKPHSAATSFGRRTCVSNTEMEASSATLMGATKRHCSARLCVEVAPRD